MSNFKTFRQRPALILISVFLWITAILPARAQILSALAARGYTVLPVPQEVSLGSQDFSLTDGWQLVLERGIKADEVAVESLKEQLADRFHLILAESQAA